MRRAAPKAIGKSFEADRWFTVLPSPPLTTALTADRSFPLPLALCAGLLVEPPLPQLGIETGALNFALEATKSPLQALVVLDHDLQKNSTPVTTERLFDAELLKLDPRYNRRNAPQRPSGIACQGRKQMLILGKTTRSDRSSSSSRPQSGFHRLGEVTDPRGDRVFGSSSSPSSPGVSGGSTSREPAPVEPNRQKRKRAVGWHRRLSLEKERGLAARLLFYSYGYEEDRRAERDVSRVYCTLKSDVR